MKAATPVEKSDSSKIWRAARLSVAPMMDWTDHKNLVHKLHQVMKNISRSGANFGAAGCKSYFLN